HGGRQIPRRSTRVGLALNTPNIGNGHREHSAPAAFAIKPPPSPSPLFPLTANPGANQSNLELSIGSATLTSGISVFHSASAFAGALSSTLNGTNKIYRLVAVGQLNAAANTFVASRISVALYE